MDETLRAIEPVRLRLMNGQEAQFLLTMGGMRRIKQRLGVKTIAELLSKDVEECGVPILFESMLNRNGQTEEMFAEMLPADLLSTTKAIAQLLGASFPEPATNGNAARPTTASEPPSS